MSHHDVEAARLPTLFADVINHIPALLEPLPPLERAWCLDINTRTGHVAQTLRERGAYRVWATDRDRRSYTGGGHRFLGGELHWLADHPHLALDRPQGFDVLICGWGLERALPADADNVRSALTHLRRLLADGGCWVFDLPALRPGDVPTVVEHPTGLRVMTQGHGERFYEVRAAPGVPPERVTGPCYDFETWRAMLHDAGWVIRDDTTLGERRRLMVV